MPPLDPYAHRFFAEFGLYVDRSGNPDTTKDTVRPHFYVAKRFEQMVKVLKRRKKASFEKVKV